MQFVPDFVALEHFMSIPDVARMFDINETSFSGSVRREPEIFKLY